MATAGKPVPKSNLVAAQSGDRRQALEVLRDTLAASMDVVEPNVAAQLAGQYRACLADLAALPAVEVQSKRDELRERRAARTADRVAKAKQGSSAG